jgi:hypothetical protein
MQSLASYLARPNSIEEEDRSSTIKVATWILLGVTVAFFFTRQVMKAIVFRKVALDDFFILAATVCSLQNILTASLKLSRYLPLDYRLQYLCSRPKVLVCLAL